MDGMDPIMEDVEYVNSSTLSDVGSSGMSSIVTETVKRHPPSRRNNSTSTMMVDDTLSRPNNENTILGVSEVVYSYIRASSRPPMKKVRSIEEPSSENQPPITENPEVDGTLPTVDQIAKYFRLIFKTAQCSVDCTIVCLIYLERLMATSSLQITIRNWRSLIAIGMLLASKVNDDLSMVNADFAVFLPFTVDQINAWERNFLAGIKYDVRVSTSQYTKYYFDLREKIKREFAFQYPERGAIQELDPQRAERLEVLSAKVQRRFEEMRNFERKASGPGASKLRRAVSDQQPSTQHVGDALPDAPHFGHVPHYVVE